MGLFSSEQTCDEESPNAKDHIGDFEETDSQWIGKFKPRKQDNEYIYGYREEENYYRCTECGKLLRPRYYVEEDEFVKVPKREVPEETLEELEVALRELRWRNDI